MGQGLYLRARKRCAFLVALLLCACGEPAGPPAEPMHGFEVLYSLLEFGEELELLEAPKDSAPRQDLFKPRRSGDEDFSTYPAVIVRAPTHMRYQLPPSHGRAELRFTLAPAMNAYAGQGKLRVSATLSGEPCFDVELDCSRDVPEEQRLWRHYTIPVPRGGVLEFRVDYTGPRKLVPELGLGRLQVGVPFTAPRTTVSGGRPNVLLVVIDTLRADRLGCYGADKPLTPVMDSLASRGTRFAAAYSAAPWTLPGTASILTGKSPPEHGIGASGSFYLPDAHDTLGEICQRQGLTTAAFTCNPLIAAGRNFDQGFESFKNYRWPSSNLILDDVVEWLRANGDQRFFLYLHPTDPHYPYEPSAESAARFVGEAPEGFFAGELRPETGRHYFDPEFDTQLLVDSNAHQFDLYDGEVFDVDVSIGRILEELEALGVLDETIVCITSDHGEEFLEQGWVGHGSQLFDEQVRVPLIMAGPGVPAGEVVTAPLENRHLVRTLLEAAQLSSPAHLLSPNLLERGAVYLINGATTFADFERREMRKLKNAHSVIQGRWRMLFGNPAPPDTEQLIALYDLSTDPDCRINVAAEHPDKVRELRILGQTWQQAGRARRPRLVPTTAGTLELLRSNGYLGDE
jgi:arylsulfatase A-like enzyme